VFNEASLEEIIQYLVIMGVFLGLFQMLPRLMVGTVKQLIRLIRKEKVEELKKELGSQCMSEIECQDRLKAAVKDEIGPPLEKIEASIRRVHTRIDQHMNSTVKAGQ
jgi:hypothetical protein